jgi:hypothetical protein
MTEGIPPQVSAEAAAMKANPGAEIALLAEAIGKSRTSTVFALHLRHGPRRQRRSGLAPDRPEGNRRADRTVAAAEGSAAVDAPAQRAGQPPPKEAPQWTPPLSAQGSRRRSVEEHAHA